MRIYNIALIGCGQMGATHLDDIYFKENVKITYVCDKNIERAELFKRKYNACNVVEDYRECIKKEEAFCEKRLPFLLSTPGSRLLRCR